MTSNIPHQALYRRWRAQTFEQIVGQEAVVETLRNAVRTDRVSHALLFVGPRGTGKTSLARIVAKAVNCLDLQDGDACDRCDACVAIRDGTTLDVLEIDAASNRGINEVRELRDRLAYPPGHLRRKVYILDEAHQITRDAWNALLKSIEEPPPFVIFMFASTEPSGFPAAILSRLQRYDVRRLTTAEIEGKLRRILDADGRDLEPEAMALVARAAAGGMRDAESILDQLLSVSTESITADAVRDLLGLAEAAAVDGFVAALLSGDAAAGMDILDSLEERGRDPRALLDQVIEAIRIGLVAAARAGDARASAALADVARRLVAVDPDRAAVGGLRLQLELTLFAPPAATPIPATIDRAAATPQPATRTIDAAPRSIEPAVSPAAVPSDPEPAAAEPPPAEPSSASPVPDTMPSVQTSPGEPAAIDVRPSVGGDELDRLIGGWPTIVATVSPATRAVLAECRPIAIDGASVTIGFPEAKGFLKDHAERKRADVEAAIAGFLQHPVNLRTVATNIELSEPAVSDDLVAEARRIFADDLVDVGEVS